MRPALFGDFFYGYKAARSTGPCDTTQQPGRRRPGLPSTLMMDDRRRIRRGPPAPAAMAAAPTKLGGGFRV